MSVKSGTIAVLALALAFALFWPASSSKSNDRTAALATISPSALAIDVNLRSEKWEAN
jgi:hypothetical protein